MGKWSRHAVLLAGFIGALSSAPAHAVKIHCIAFDGLNARHLVTDDIEVGKIDATYSLTLQPYEDAWLVWLRSNVRADFSPNQKQCRHFNGDDVRLKADRDFFRNDKGSYKYVEIHWNPPGGLTPKFFKPS